MSRCKTIMLAEGETLVPRTCPVHGFGGCPPVPARPDAAPSLPAAVPPAPTPFGAGRPPFDDFVRRAVVRRVVDGDTLDVTVDIGYRVKLDATLRLYGIDCPERGTDPGVRARVFVVLVLQPGASAVTVRSLKEDKYGSRWDAVVWLADGRCLNDLLVEAGHAVRKEYKAPTPWE